MRSGKKRKDPFRRAAAILNRRLEALTGGRRPGEREIIQHLSLLYTGSGTKEKAELYYEEKTALALKVLSVGLLLILLLLFTSGQSALLKESYFLPRKEYAYGTELTLEAEDGTKEKVNVQVEPRRLTKEESRKLLEETVEQMETYILGENSSLEEVRRDLTLIQEIPETPITVEWELGSYEVLNLDGSIRTEQVREEGTLVELTAVLTCREETAVYRGCARVLPPVLSGKELWDKEVEEEMKRLGEESSEEERLELPRQIQGRAVIWQESLYGGIAAVLLLLPVCVAAVYTSKDRELKKQVQERELQMKQDYAGIVSKLVLLMGAGSTIRHAWETLVRDYEKKRRAGKIQPRYAYEEMSLAVHEMQNGKAEARAYEDFGIRCRVSCYLKLAGLLEQNLKKGNRGLTQLLELEVREAFEQRKDLARRQGEEASTKLLFPMILMLVVVMIIILVPAGMSMKM